MRCLLVDKIISWEAGKRISGIKNVTMSENFLQDHFPGFPVMPGVLQFEAVLQLASWLMLATSGFSQRLTLDAVQSIKFKEFIVPGDQMRIDLDMNVQDDGRAVCSAKIHVGEKLKSEIRQIKLSPVPVEELEDPARAKAHFAFISGSAPMGSYRHSRGGVL